jgi:predicted ABC-type ATPase
MARETHEWNTELERVDPNAFEPESSREFLPHEGGILNFVNADLIAAGLSPLLPTATALSAGRIFLSELDRLAASGADFSFESTLSGLTYIERLKHWKARDYRIEIIYLRLSSVEVAIKRIAQRVKAGGHHVPSADVRRRFTRSWTNFEQLYRPLSDAWWLFDATAKPPTLLDKQP